MIALRHLLNLLVCFLLPSKATAIKCYYCDNSVSTACGRYFKAYQFEAIMCPEHNGLQPMCGKQEQPPDKSGWIGVIRSCYYPGELPGINETVGCHHYFHNQNNFTALYCFCDTGYCNGSTPTSKMRNWDRRILVLLSITISALVCREL